MSRKNSDGISVQSGQPIKTNNIESYRICEVIDFFPENLLLRNILNGKEASLFSPASKCLEALIERQGDVITQKELMYIGWEAAGAPVTHNAYYQNISSIRRALKELSENGFDYSNIVKTIKRNGLIINADIKITPKYLDDTNNLDIDEKYTGKSCHKKPLNNDHPKWHILLKQLLLIISSMCLVLTMYILFSKKSFFDNYFFLKSISEGCSLYLNIDANKTLLKGSLFDGKEFNCEGFNKGYVTIFPNHTRSSVLLCSETQTRLSCTSYYYASNSK